MDTITKELYKIADHILTKHNETLFYNEGDLELLEDNIKDGLIDAYNLGKGRNPEELIKFAEWVSVNKYKFDGISIWRKYYTKGEVFYTTKQVVDQYLKENK